MEVFNKSLVLTLFITTLLLSSFHALAEDDYLQMLEAEADDVQLDQGGMRANDNKQREQQLSIVEKKWRGECAYDKDVLQLHVPRDEFSSYLKQCSLSLFVYYRKLDASSQTLVYEEYRNVTPIKFTSLKKSIVKYL